LKHQSFLPDKTAVFTARPNRFVVYAQSGEENLMVHCPNPGRMREILIPGRKLILEKSENPNRKSAWTLAAAEYQNQIIPLVSARANSLVGKLLLPELFPGFTQFPEKTFGNSRFDWFLEKNQNKTWLEVKACTLVEYGRAMFPDAPSVRAVKHSEELTAINDGSQRVIIFAVMNPAAVLFSPNPHTDPGLCLSLGNAVKSGVRIRAVSFKTDKHGWTVIENSELPLDMSTVEMAREDSGVLIRVWESDDRGPSWRVTVERYAENLSKGSRRKNRNTDRPGDNYIERAMFPIRGHLDCFDSMEFELDRVLRSEFENPVQNQFFLEWILDYRHRRVFSA
jgi:sugar fermentation stimulation protein A